MRLIDADKFLNQDMKVVLKNDIAETSWNEQYKKGAIDTDRYWINMLSKQETVHPYDNILNRLDELASYCLEIITIPHVELSIIQRCKDIVEEEKRRYDCK